jgi:hypothetical protein
VVSYFGPSHRCAKAAVVTVAFALSRHQHASKLAATVISGCKSDNFFATSFSHTARFLTRHLEPPTAQDAASTARRIAGGAASGVLHTPQSLDVENHRDGIVFAPSNIPALELPPNMIASFLNYFLPQLNLPSHLSDCGAAERSARIVCTLFIHQMHIRTELVNKNPVWLRQLIPYCTVPVHIGLK